MNIPKRQHIIVLVQNIRRNFFVDNFCKDGWHTLRIKTRVVLEMTAEKISQAEKNAASLRQDDQILFRGNSETLKNLAKTYQHFLYPS
jgi:hypothetical protein